MLKKKYEYKFLQGEKFVGWGRGLFGLLDVSVTKAKFFEIPVWLAFCLG